MLTLPSTPLLRVSRDPLALPSPPLVPPGSGRYDDPDGEYVVRYVGVTLRSCLLETMVSFRPDVTLEATLEKFNGEITWNDRDPTMEDAIGEWLSKQQVGTFFPRDTDTRVFDINDIRQLVEIESHPQIQKALADYGFNPPKTHLDQGVVRLDGEGRRITQAISQVVWKEEKADGIAYRSMYDDNEQCFALFQRIFDHDWASPEVRPLDPSNQGDREAVQHVSKLYGIPLPPEWSY